MNRREFLKKSAAAGAGVAVSSTLGLSSSRALGLGRSVTPQEAGPDSSFHCKWGAFALPIGGQKIMEALLALEQKVGRRFAIHRDYQGMDVDIISNDVIWLGNRGTIPYRSFHAWSGGKTNFINWAGIAAGKHDTWLKKQAAAVGAWGKPIYLSFHHEPEVWPQCGSAADFRAAWNHVRQIFHRVDNATWVVTLLSPTFYGNNGGPKAWLPSPANYDVLGVDGYNRCTNAGASWESLQTGFTSAQLIADRSQCGGSGIYVNPVQRAFKEAAGTKGSDLVGFGFLPTRPELTLGLLSGHPRESRRACSFGSDLRRRRSAYNRQRAIRPAPAN